MPLPYRVFGTYFLHDRAESVRSDGDRVIFNGNHISRQFIRPVQGEQESEHDFAERFAAFKKRLPRGGDQVYRRAIAHEAFLRAGEKSFGAAEQVFEILSELPRTTELARQYWESLGVPYKTITSRIGRTRRGRRRKRKKPELCPGYRMIETIRCEVSRYKSRHPEFNQAFENELTMFRSVYCRDSDFCATEEANRRELLKCCENELSPCDQVTATHTIALARILHEQGKNTEALPVYWLGLVRCWAADWAPHYRETLLSTILREIESCQCGQPPVCDPNATVHTGHLRLYRVTG
jgi:hypothetical protein